MAGEHEANFLKIILLLMKYGSKVLQHRIEFELRDREWQLVTQFLDKRKHDILHLTFDKQKRCCIKDCKIPNSRKCLIHYNLLKLMYEDVKKSCSTKFIDCCSCNLVPKTDLDINDWDITLTSCLLLEVICFKDAGQKQAIQNLRNLRNSKELLHRGNAEMQDDEFEKMWIRLSNDIKEVAEKCEPYFYSSICEDVDRLKDNPLEQGESYKAQECWKELKKNEENSIQSLVNLLTSSKSELKWDIEVENIYGYSKYCLEDHTKKIGMYVAPKKAINHSLKALEHHRLIVITGEAGSGKTRFGLQLMSQMQRKHQNLIALILTEFSQWNKLDFKREYILFIDDLLGKSNANDLAFQGWSMAFDSMHKILLTNHVIIIFALRNCIWHLMKDRLADYTLFRLLNSSNPPVDLSGEFVMTPREKLRMLNSYRSYNNVNMCSAFHKKNISLECSRIGPLCICQETLRIIADMNTVHGFPFLCEKFFSDQESLKQGSSFFHISARIYMKGQMDELLCKEKYLHYAVLVFLCLKDGLLEKEEISKFKKEIVHVAGQIGDINPKKIINATVLSCLNDMVDIFISLSDKGYRLRHMVIEEAVLMSFGENFSEEFLKLVHKTVLFTYVRSNGYICGDQEVVVQLEDNMTESLAKKLIDVYWSNKEEAYSDVYKHPSFEDKKLVDCFLDILEGEESFKVFVKSFLAGACKERKDILASEVIRRFVSSDEFDSDILDLILNNDLIDSFRQYMNVLGFGKLFLKLKHESSGVQFLNKIFGYGARKCLMDILNNLDADNDLETDCDKKKKTWKLAEICNAPFSLFGIREDYADRRLLRACWDHLFQSWLCDIRPHHDPSSGNDWTNVLTKLAELCPSIEIRNDFYLHIIQFSIIHDNFDSAYGYLEKIQNISEKQVCILIEFFWYKKIDLSLPVIHLLCRKIKNVHFECNSQALTGAILRCIRRTGMEDMFLTFLNEIPCNFYYHIRGRTILHVCEERNFSDSTLLRLLQRPEGMFMFTSVDEEGRTPVQCRGAYKKIRRKVASQGASSQTAVLSPQVFLGYPRKMKERIGVNHTRVTDVGQGAADHCCIRDIDWRDDTLVVNSSFKDLHVHDVAWRDDTLVLNTSLKDRRVKDVKWWRYYLRNRGNRRRLPLRRYRLPYLVLSAFQSQNLRD